MLIVNLYGSPGAGKSTGAAYVFSVLKMAGINAELVTEFAKDKVWKGSGAAFKNQAYIFGEQFFRISRVQDKVDVVITDSPLLLSSFYADGELLGSEFDALCTKVSKSYDSMDVFIDRVKAYNPAGRFQNEAESDLLSEKLQEFLADHDVACKHFDGCVQGYNALAVSVFERIKHPKTV